MYDHYIALDWAQSNMAIARMTKESEKIQTKDVPSNIKELQFYLTHLKGKKILTFEETTTSQWLYTELKDYVDEILVCDPYRNHLLSEGPKTDKLDAVKLVQLLRGGLLKPVFHSADQFIEMRKLISGYQDVVKAGVRLKNQRASLFRAKGQNKREKSLNDPIENFVLEGVDEDIASYEKRKKHYEEEMGKISKKYLVIRNLDTVPGIGLVGALKIAATVVDPKRFQKKGRWLSYCGLIKHEKMSGGRSYGKKDSRYSRTLKSVFKTAALSVIGENVTNDFKNYYEELLTKKGCAEHNARHAVSRRIAILTLGVFKSGKPFSLKKKAELIQK